VMRKSSLEREFRDRCEATGTDAPSFSMSVCHESEN
jgi:hypothetical protein